MQILLKMLGYGVALFSAFCILVFAAILFDGEEDEAFGTQLEILEFLFKFVLYTRRHADNLKWVGGRVGDSPEG